MNDLAKKIYYGKNPGDLPAYNVTEVAHYLRVPPFTLHYWMKPVEIETKNGYARKPLIQRPNGSAKMSFLNVVEAHVVNALRLHHQVPVAEMRMAVEYAENHLGVNRLLTNQNLKAGAKQLFIEEYGRLINLGRGGQYAIEKMLEKYLERIDYEKEIPIRLFPFSPQGEAKLISIAPQVAFGKPVIASSGIVTKMIADRFNMGESKSEIATDYGITEEEVDEAIIYEEAA